MFSKYFEFDGKIRDTGNGRSEAYLLSIGIYFSLGAMLL